MTSAPIGLPCAEHVAAKASGRRSAQAAFDRVAACNYGVSDLIFREIGVALLSKWEREEGRSAKTGEVWLANALAHFDVLVTGRGQRRRVAAPGTDLFAHLRDVVSGTTRTLGYTLASSQLSPKHWQHVLALVEARMRTRGIELPEGWREEVAAQMGPDGS